MRNLFLVTIFIFQCVAAFPQFRVHNNGNVSIGMRVPKAQESNSQIKYYEDGKSWLWAGYRLTISGGEEKFYWTETVVGDTIVEGRNAKKLLIEDESSESISIGLEEDGVIYSYGLGPEKNDSTCFYPEMDFNLHAGDSVFLDKIYFGESLFYFEVVKEDTINVCGIERRRLTLKPESNYIGYWVEGIGSNVPFYFYLTWESSRGYGYHMVKCFKDGECIFTADDFYASTDGIDDVSVTGSDKNRATDEALYDLSGRKITGTPRRGIYIKGGRKVLVK